MRYDKARQVVSEALTYRGFSESEADHIIKLLTTTTKENEHVHEPISKTIDMYV